MLEHTAMGRICKAKRDKLNEYFNTRPAPGREPNVLTHLHLITNTFVEMLEHRHTADYNGAVKWSRTDVLEKIESVEAAFRSWKEIRDEHEAQDFLATLLLRERKQ